MTCKLATASFSAIGARAKLSRSAAALLASALYSQPCLHTAVRVCAFNEHARVHTWGRHITKAPVTFRLRENALSDCQEKGKTVLEIKDANDLGWFQVMLLRMQLSKSRSGSKRIT